jgi:hypothetical protein
MHIAPSQPRRRCELPVQIDPRTWLRLPLPTLLIGLVTAALIMTTLYIAIEGGRTTELLATLPKAPAALSFDLSDVPRNADLASIKSQPLVYASRAFFIAPPADATPATPPRPDYRLAGIFLVPRKPAVALLVNRQSGANRRVRPGDELDGWRVRAVDSSHVTLAYDAESFELHAAPFVASAGLKRVPMTRARVASAGGGVQSLSATGSATNAFAGGPNTDPPRLYRPPPQ